MADFRDKLKESQGQASTFVKLPIVRTYDMKLVDGTVVFQYWNKAEEKNEGITFPIEGMYIGSAMMFNIFDDNLGRDGGSYISSHYFDRNQVSIFKPEKGTYVRVYQGDLDGAEKFAGNTTGKQLKKKMCLFVLNEAGLMEIRTNIAIAIENMGKIKDGLSSNYIVLTPELYSPTDTTIAKRVHEILGKLAKGNPPRFARVTLGEPLREEDFNDWGASELVDMYKAYKAQQMAAPKPKAQEQPPLPTLKEQSEAENKPMTYADNPLTNNEIPEDYKDDLPF